jgi:hypothetical protein
VAGLNDGSCVPLGLCRRRVMSDDKKKKKKCCEGYLKKGKMCSSCPLQDKDKKKKDKKKKEKKKKKDKKDKKK